MWLTHLTAMYALSQCTIYVITAYILLCLAVKMVSFSEGSKREIKAERCLFCCSSINTWRFVSESDNKLHSCVHILFIWVCFPVWIRCALGILHPYVLVTFNSLDFFFFNQGISIALAWIALMIWELIIYTLPRLSVLLVAHWRLPWMVPCSFPLNFVVRYTATPSQSS